VDCSLTKPPDNVEFLTEFNQKATQQRVPLSGSVELTQRCNLTCVHCYLRPRGTFCFPPASETRTPESAPPGRKSESRPRGTFCFPPPKGAPKAASRESRMSPWELTTAQWLAILDQATEAGCLELLMTGGEPLLRPDFAVIYRHARQNGLLVMVFTNGTLVTDETAALFADMPPRQVEVTLYGATGATYERITGVRGSFAACLAGLRRLLDARVPVGLKTVLMTLNRHEFSAMQQLAAAMGVRFRFDAAIFPRFDGDRTPLRLRVPAREAVARELADEGTVQKWRDFVRRQGAIAPTQALYQCAAGLTGFHVDAVGRLSPCLMTSEPSCSLLEHSFRTGWDTVIPQVLEKRARAESACGACAKRVFCGYCPAYFALENGAEDVCSEYLCALGHLRYKVIAGEAAEEYRRGDSDELPVPAVAEAALREAQASCH